jgi:hypothetical protein
VSTGAHDEPATELAEILRVHVTPEIESIDRMHLNVRPTTAAASRRGKLLRFHRPRP